MGTEEHDLLAVYLREIREKAFIAVDEPNLLAKVWAGDTAARQTLIKSYLSVTADLALRLAPPELEPLQAVQEANLVLLRLTADCTQSPAAALGPAIEEHLAELE